MFSGEFVNWIVNAPLDCFLFPLSAQVNIMAMRVAILMLGVWDLEPGLSYIGYSNLVIYCTFWW